MELSGKSSCLKNGLFKRRQEIIDIEIWSSSWARSETNIIFSITKFVRLFALKVLIVPIT